MLQVVGNLVESEGPLCSVGDACTILMANGESYTGEVVGFRGTVMLTMTLKLPRGVQYGDRIVAVGSRPSIRVGAECWGVSSMGRASRLITWAPTVHMLLCRWMRKRLSL